jgi:hypothetical protein
MIEAATRLKGVEQLINQKQYFVIHAARQSEKTTYIRDLTQRLNAEGQYYALYCSLETVQNVVEPERGIPAIVRSLKSHMKYSTLPRANEFAKDADYSDYNNLLRNSLIDYCILSDKPLVIFFDEVDCLSEDTLIPFLRQLRSGYNERSTTPFVHSIVLVGMRNIRDYKAKIRPDSQSLGSVSPFNIVAKSLTLKNFTPEEIACLYQSDYTKPVTTGLVNEAIQHIILNRPTHIDSLIERLKEERVRKIIEPVILGEGYINRNSDDFLYTRDLGIVCENDDSQIKPGNPIYAEMIGRYLSSDTQDELQNPKYPYRMLRYMKKEIVDGKNHHNSRTLISN